MDPPPFSQKGGLGGVILGITTLLGGCNLLSGVPAGTITGQIDFDGRPAPGITVRLQTQDKGIWADYRPSGSQVLATTDSSGLYRFAGLKSGTYRVHYEITPVFMDGTQVGPKHVGRWDSSGVAVDPVGARVSTFDVSYNGLIYPESGRSSSYSEGSPLPIHWGTHRNAVSYRVNLYETAGGVVTKRFWQSGPTMNPVTSFNHPTQKGNYRWEVEIDGGAAGTGTSELRNVDLDYQAPQASASA